MLCDSSNLHKQNIVKPKPLASKMAAVKKERLISALPFTTEWVCCRLPVPARFRNALWDRYGANKLAKAKAIVNNSFIHRCGISFSKISLIFTIMAGIRLGRREVIVCVDGNCFYRAMGIKK